MSVADAAAGRLGRQERAGDGADAVGGKVHGVDLVHGLGELGGEAFRRVEAGGGRGRVTVIGSGTLFGLHGHDDHVAAGAVAVGHGGEQLGAVLGRHSVDDGLQGVELLGYGQQRAAVKEVAGEAAGVAGAGGHGVH